MLKSLLAFSLAGVLFQTAGTPTDLATFRKQREVEIGGETGWAALTGLHWLTNGTMTVGRDSRNAVVLTAPSAPATLGTLNVTDTSVTLHVAAGVPARVKGQPVTEVQLRPGTEASDGLTVGGMTMVVIKRGRGMALRVWDAAAPGRIAFKGLRWYPAEPKLKVEAKFMPQPRHFSNRRSFAQHLGDRIARNQMNQAKDQRNDDPDHRQRESNAANYKCEHRFGSITQGA